MLPLSADALEAMLPEYLGAEQKEIVAALTAIARLVSARVSRESAPLPAAVGEALSTLDAWCGGMVDDEALEAATSSLQDIRESVRAIAHQRALVSLLFCVLRKATYEDHDDWPAEVVLPAVRLLCQLGEEEPRAVQLVSSALQGHGVL
jgi:hypothetical protein